MNHIQTNISEYIRSNIDFDLVGTYYSYMREDLKILRKLNSIGMSDLPYKSSYFRFIVPIQSTIKAEARGQILNEYDINQ